MQSRTEEEVLTAMLAGAENAFEQVYEVYCERVRLAAWRVSHRSDWLDDILNEAWCRAYNHRMSYDPSRPFLVWIIGIVRNVYREECRRSPRTWTGGHDPGAEDPADSTSLTPERLAEEAELLAGLNDCVSRLTDADAQLVRMRFFEGLPLRAIARKLGVPEATLRDTRIQAIYRTLRDCLQKKGIRFSEVFPAQGDTGDQ